MQPRSVLLIDPHTLWRLGIVLLLRQVFPRAALHQVADLDEAALETRSLRPDLVVLGVDDPGVSWPGSVQCCRERWPAAALVLLLDREAPAWPALQAAGVDGLIARTAPAAAIVQLLQDRLGQGPLGGGLPSAGVIPGLGGRSDPPIALPTLTTAADGASPSSLGGDWEGLGLSQRQLDVLRLLSLGQTNKEISRALGLAESTVKTHVLGLFQKLGLVSRTEAAFWAASRGLGQGSSGQALPLPVDPAETSRSA